MLTCAARTSSVPIAATSAKDVGDKLACDNTLPDFKAAGAADALLCEHADDNVIVAWFSSAAQAVLGGELGQP